MGRPSTRAVRRRELALAYERALARHGVGGATIAAVAEEAGVAPALVHHHFQDREDLVLELVRTLAARFRGRLGARGARNADDLDAWLVAALAPTGDDVEPRAWVGLLAEGIRSRPVGELLRRALTAELERLERLEQARGRQPGEPDRTTRSSAAFELATVVASDDGRCGGGPVRGVADASDGASDAEKRRAETGGDARIGEARDRAAGLLALTVGALVVGAVVPGWAPGFALRVARRMV